MDVFLNYFQLSSKVTIWIDIFGVWRIFSLACVDGAVTTIVENK